MFEGVGRRRRAIEEEEFEGEEDEDSMLEKLDSPRVFVWIPGQEENKEGKLKPSKLHLYIYVCRTLSQKEVSNTNILNLC